MLSVVIPTINEKQNLMLILPHLKHYAQEIVVVDDGSTDGTIEVARNAGCKIIERGKRLGVGSAVYDGVKAATGDIVAVMDADHSHPIEALRSVSLIEVDVVDVIKFSRFIAGGGMEAQSRHFLMRYFNSFLAMIAGVHVQDFAGGYVLAKRSTFNFRPTAVHGEWNIEFMIHNRKRRIAEIPYIYRRRTIGSSNWNRWQDLGRIFRYLFYLFIYRFQSIFARYELDG